MRERTAIEQLGAAAAIGQRLRRTGQASRRFARAQPLGAGAVLVIIVLMIFGVFAPLLDRYPPNLMLAFERLEGPSAKHWFGTDHAGRDIYSNIINGTRISLYVGFFSVGLGTTVGYLLGIFSGYVGGKTDMLLQRVVDAMLAFPSILLALSLVSVLGAGLDKVIAAISIVYIPRAARVARGVSLSVKENVYVDAATVIGATRRRIMIRHILPNSMAPYLILASLSLGTAIIIEASLSYLGLGIPPPATSWGRMLAGQAQEFGFLSPAMLIAPGVAIMVVVLTFNLFGDAIRDVWDPRLRGAS